MYTSDASIRLLTGTAIGAAVGAGLALAGVIANDRKMACARKAMCDRLPVMHAHPILLDGLLQLQMATGSDGSYEHVERCVVSFLDMERAQDAPALQVNRAAEQAIAAFSYAVNSATQSASVSTREAASSIDIDAFAGACGDVIHNLILRLPEVLPQK